MQLLQAAGWTFKGNQLVDQKTGEPFTIPGIFVLRVRDGKIVESRDYLDHLRSAQARGHLTEVLDAVSRHYAPAHEQPA